MALITVLSKMDNQQHMTSPHSTHYQHVYSTFIILVSHSSPQLFPSPSTSRRVTKIHRLIHGLLPYSLWHSPTLAGSFALLTEVMQLLSLPISYLNSQMLYLTFPLDRSNENNKYDPNSWPRELQATYN